MTSKEFKEFIKTPKGKATMFFGAYLLFFLFIGIFARTGGTSNINKKYETGSPLRFNINSILNNNFKYNYAVNIDGLSTVYSGTSTKVNSLFKINDTYEYYFNGNNYFANTNGVWLNVSNPVIYSKFMDTNFIKALLDKATYVSKTEYDSGDDVYNFKIATATISKLFDGTDVDVEEIPNEISIGADEDNNITEVKYLLDSYCKAKNLCVSNMSVTLKYEDIGKIVDIASPLE
jgi:hypothetical protein